MSVRKFWLAADPQHSAEFTVETGQDPLQPEGIVRRDSDDSILEPTAIKEGLARAIRIAALCNVAA